MKGAVAVTTYEEADIHLKNIGYGSTNYTNITLAAEALSRNIAVQKTHHGRILLKSGDRSRTWRGGATNHNSVSSRKITRYKDVCSSLLRNSGVDTPENATFGAHETERAWQWSATFSASVVKPNDGVQGRDVHVNLSNFEEFAEAFHEVTRSHKRVLVEEFRTGTEHRCLMVDDQLVAAATRRPASVLGDGEHTVRQLVNRKNADRGRIHKQIQLKGPELRTLSQAGMSTESVPLAGTRVFLRQTSNIHTGGDALDATDSLSETERQQIEQAARAVPGLRVAGLDVLLDRSEHGGETACILEINTNPMTSMHHFPWEGTSRNVSSHILDSMFPGTVNG